MELSDFFIGPIYFIVIFIIAYFIKNRNYKNSVVGQYYLKALMLKLLGAVFIGVIYWFYYKGGDTINYFTGIQILQKSFLEDPAATLNFIFNSSNLEDPSVYTFSTKYWMFRDSASLMVIKIGFFLGFLCFHNYTAIALFFAFFSFLGVWKLYLTIVDIFPDLHKEFALSCFYIPSLYIWGSGIFKDTVSFAALGFLTYYSYQFFIKAKFKPGYFAYIILWAYLVFVIKGYIILSFAPALMFWVFLKNQEKIKSKAVRMLIAPFIIVITLGLAMGFIQYLGNANTYWSVEQLQDRAKDMQWWHTKVVELSGESGGGSFYSVGDGSFTLRNIILSFPVAVSITLFGPPIWKAGSVIMLLAALESMFLLFITLNIILRIKWRKLLGLLVQPTPFFLLSFSIVFAFAIGFTSFNYGALVRYKIPSIPFFLSGIYVLKYLSTKKDVKEAID